MAVPGFSPFTFFRQVPLITVVPHVFFFGALPAFFQRGLTSTLIVFLRQLYHSFFYHAFPTRTRGLFFLILLFLSHGLSHLNSPLPPLPFCFVASISLFSSPVLPL